MAFFDQVLAYFGVFFEVLMDQERESFWSFEALCIKALIDHYTTSRNHLEADGLTEQVIQSMKCGLWKYGLLYDKHHD
uniref:Uncharacterized protein n=1 Tax=Physcomitrium patens TaxID=3218 RepID=A0A2K1KW46_PHYPA|nr:hypothetical protein PHYPA_005017 [Physcomitrium patens]